MAAANEESCREQLSAMTRLIRKEAGIDFQDDYETLSIVVEKNDSSSSSATPYEEWLKVMTEGEPTKQEPSAHMIRKVPDMLRQKESSQGCFDPLVVSIGPYHHGKSQLEEMERLKTKMALQFVEDRRKLFQCIYNEVEEVSNIARKCYPPDSTNQFDEKEFTKMMFLDGCFILLFIERISKHEIKDMKRNIAAYVRRDLLLLENQLPYQVLKVLMGFKDGKCDEVIDQFINRIRGFHGETFIEKTMKSFTRCYSLLGARSETKKGQNEPEHVHLLDRFRTRFINKKARTPNKNHGDWYSYPAAKELRTSGIHFRPSWGNCFTDIKYIQIFPVGMLFLPKLIIDDTTKSLLLNLVAYEASCEALNDCDITSYVCFMDSLIDQAEDVKELRKKRIIFNLLGSDQQAADLFNEIANDLVPDPEAFLNTKNGIEQHSKSIWKTWMAECLHDHFSSPWTVCAFLAAAFALLLTFLQTYLSLIDHCSGTGKQKHKFPCVSLKVTW